jgi:hypothetical protein
MKKTLNTLLVLLALLISTSNHAQNTTYNELNYSFRQYVTNAGKYHVVLQQNYDQVPLTVTYLDEVSELDNLTYSSVFSLSLYYVDPKAKSEADLSRSIKFRYDYFPYKVTIDTIGYLKKKWDRDEYETIIQSPDKKTLEFKKRNFNWEQLRHELDRSFGNKYRRYILKKNDVIVDTLYCSVTKEQFEPIFFTVKKLDELNLKQQESNWNKLMKEIQRPQLITEINQRFGERLLKDIFIDGELYIYKVFFNGKSIKQPASDRIFKIEQFIFSSVSPDKITKEILLKNVNYNNEICTITFNNFEFLKKVNLIDFYPRESQQILELYGVDYNKFIDLNMLTIPYNALKKNTNTNLAEYTNNYFLTKFEKDTSFITKESFFIRFDYDEIEIYNGKYVNNSYMMFKDNSFKSDELIYTSKLDFDRFNYNPWETFSESLVDINHNLANRCVDRVYEIKSELVTEQNNAANEQKSRKAVELKYGKKYVDEAMKGNIIVGMHEDLLDIPLRLWTFERKTTSNDTQTYYFHSKLDSSAKMLISVNNKKVTRVYTW